MEPFLGLPDPAHFGKTYIAVAPSKPFVYESVWKWLNITENGCKTGCKVSTKTRPLFASKLPKLEGLRPRRKDRTKKPLPPLLNLCFTTKFIKFIVIRAFLNSKGLFPGWGITMYNQPVLRRRALQLNWSLTLSSVRETNKSWPSLSALRSIAKHQRSQGEAHSLSHESQLFVSR